MNKAGDKRIMRTKKSFRRALLSLLGRKHFDEISITDIVREADYNRGTFYVHYEKKEDLLQEIIDDVLNELLRAFRSSYIRLKKEANIIDLSTIAMFDHFIENKEFYQVMLGPNINHNFQKRMITMMDKHFREDIDFALSEGDPDIDTELFYTYRVYGIIGIIIEWINSNFKHSKAYMAEQIVKIASFHTKKVYIKMEG